MRFWCSAVEEPWSWVPRPYYGVWLLVFAAYPSLGLEGAIDGSALAPYFVDDFSFLLSLLPQAFEDRIDVFLDPLGT